MNDTEREQWIDNDESLYNAQQSSGLSRRKFVRQSRPEIDAHIARALSPPPAKTWRDYVR
jgi:hypothetical protein